MRTETIYLYENRTDVKLTTYILDDSPDMLCGKKRPGVLICPGGGYFNCSDREVEPVALQFAALGYHAFVLRYSTYTGGSDFPDLTKPMAVKPECLYPNAMREIGMSFLILHQRAEEWKLDAERIAVCGFSAGGHNAAMYATRWQEDSICGYFQAERELFRPAAAILCYPLTDYVYKREAEARMDPMTQGFFRKSDAAFLGSEEPDPQTLAEVSPARHVSGNTPPTFLWATARDELVPVQHSLLMAKALADCGVPFELHVFEEGMHGLSVATQAAAMAKSQLNPDTAQWVTLAGKWLEKRFALPLMEKTPFEELLERGEFPGMAPAQDSSAK